MDKHTKEQIQILLLQYISGKATVGEREKLSAYLEQEEADSDWQDILEEIMAAEPAMNEYKEADWQPIVEKIIKENPEAEKKVVRIFPFWKRVAAAAIIIMLGAGSYFLLFNNKNEKQEIAKATPPAEIINAPKSTKAVITLADGRKVSLDSLTSGSLAKEGTVNVIKTSDGKIVYDGTSSSIQYNTLYNPRGSKVVSLTLNDGTTVWLNTESSLRYPVSFSGEERAVEITGEAYFEVAKVPGKKFVVTGNGVSTEVMGTHFNVNTYNDESSVKVTLLEGAVKVSKDGSVGLLKPGQQAQVSSAVKVVNGIDLEAVMAWKNGFFYFNNTSLQDLMKQLARWYDVEVVYTGNVSAREFGGEISRESTLQEVVKVLLESNVKCKIAGKKLIVE